MQTVFIRNKLVDDPDILKRLWDERRIAIHYGHKAISPDKRISIDPNDYIGEGKKALLRLHRYCEEGAICGATYHGYRPAHMLVGYIKKGSEIFGTYDYGKNKDLPFKVVQLDQVIEVPYEKYPVLSVIQPRGRTVTGWASAEKHLNAILKGEPMEEAVTSLAPEQLEVICYEYLRVKGIIQTLQMSIGRTRKDIDIHGMDFEGNSVIAQVTQSDNLGEVNNKIDLLVGYKSNNTKLIFFGKEKHKQENENVQYIPIEEVFDYLNSGQAGEVYQLLIKKMLYIE